MKDESCRGEYEDEKLQICFSPSDEVSLESSINNKAPFSANLYSSVAVSESSIPGLSAVPIMPYMYGTSSFITGFPPANQMPTVPPIYASGILSPATALPFTPIPPQQLYIPPATVLPGASPMIPSAVGSTEMNSALKRKSLEDERDDDKNWSCGKIKK